MNNKTIKNLILSGVLAIVLVSAHDASAYVPGVWDPTPNTNPNPVFTTVVSSPNTNPYTPTTPVTPVKPNQDTVKPVNNNTTPTKPVKPVVNSNTTSTSNLPAVNTASNDNNGLTALSFKGSGGFMPSSIWQWILVVLLILAIIIIARSLSKSSSHGAHAAPAH